MHRLIYKFVFILLLLKIPAVVGCSTQRQSYPGFSAGVVWTAMMTAAESPNYDDVDPTKRWTMRVNDIWVDQDHSRIEIHRELERLLHRPGTRPLHEQRSWNFQVALESDQPPTVRFTARNLSVPAHVWIEASRFFDDVWNILGGRDATLERLTPPDNVLAEE